MERSLALSVVAAFLAGCAGGSSPSPSAALAQSASRSQVVPPASSDLVPARHQKRCAASSGGSGILPDGDFSRATDPRLGGGDQIVFQGQEFAPSWKVSKGNIDFLATTYSEWHPNGLCSVDLDGYRTAGGIEHRAFATSSGASYTVSFTMSGNGDGPPGVKTLKVSAAGQSTTLTWDTADGNDAQGGHYAEQSWVFMANASHTVLKLTSLDPKASCCGAVVAAISVTENTSENSR